MYILANGVKITEKLHQDLCEALKDFSGERAYFLDINSGKLVCISDIHQHKLKMLQKKSQKLIPLPSVNEKELLERFAAFNEEMINVPQLRTRLRKEMKKKTSMDKLKRILEKDSSGWIHGWVQDEQFFLAERIEEWITEPPLNAKDDLDYWFDDDCPVCQLMKKMEQERRQPKTSELKKAFKKAKKAGGIVGGEIMEKNSLGYIGNTQDFKMPKWMECTWRRVPCGKDDCPICGRIKKDRQRHIEKGEDFDDFENAIKDVDQNFKEALEIINKDAESKGFNIANIENIKEPPEPKKFPLYIKINQWNKKIMALEDMARLSEVFWIYTEAAADLFWYANTLMAKIYRQLCNRWHIENGGEYGDFDYQYTGRVLEECLKILKKSLRELIKGNISQKREFDLILSQLLKLEKEIINPSSRTFSSLRGK
ncbi:hypothetical protein KKH63_01255 [Patescibacteria group bacterium]|nr:hypothetical protein [Patescibacteria group bacterium]